jgi:hypothetical protein
MPRRLRAGPSLNAWRSCPKNQPRELTLNLPGTLKRRLRTIASRLSHSHTSNSGLQRLRNSGTQGHNAREVHCSGRFARRPDRWRKPGARSAPSTLGPLDWSNSAGIGLRCGHLKRSAFSFGSRTLYSAVLTCQPKCLFFPLAMLIYSPLGSTVLNQIPLLHLQILVHQLSGEAAGGDLQGQRAAVAHLADQ